MNADPKGKPRHTDRILADQARRHQEEALDDALKNTFPASDPVSIEQPAPPASARRRMANVRFGSEADIEARPFDVRFTPKSGHRPCQARRKPCISGDF